MLTLSRSSTSYVTKRARRTRVSIMLASCWPRWRYWELCGTPLCRRSRSQEGSLSAKVGAESAERERIRGSTEYLNSTLGVPGKFVGGEKQETNPNHLLGTCGRCGEEDPCDMVARVWPLRAGEDSVGLGCGGERLPSEEQYRKRMCIDSKLLCVDDTEWWSPPTPITGRACSHQSLRLPALLGCASPRTPMRRLSQIGDMCSPRMSRQLGQVFHI